MTLLRTLPYTGVPFARNVPHRRSILLSNVVSLILFGLGMMLFATYYWWYGGNVVTWSIPVLSFVCLSTLVFNHFDLSAISRVILTLFLPLSTLSLSLFAKQFYDIEAMDYFTYRFITLSFCVFPAIFFSFQEKKMLIATSITSFAILMAHDPLNNFFGVAYQKLIQKESNYAFTNIVILVTYCIMMSAVFFLKWISERNEERSAMLIHELNQRNAELIDKSNKIEQQNQEISAQSESLNKSQHRLQQAYELIEEQKNLLVRQNKHLSSELVDINKNLTDTNAELIKHNNELRQFSYTVSHNLRGPVASLIGLLSLIDPRNLNQQNSEIVEHFKTSVNRLDNIISDLSQIIDIRHDIFHIREKIRLEKEVKDILLGFQKDIDACGVIIKTDFSQCPEIYSIRPMVHSILYNLINNAIKYRAATRIPEVSISSSLNGHYVLQVKDNGLGIDLKSHENNLFKLYKRFHFHTEGKGLGLYLVRLQAEALGGRIDVSSEVNQQTTFTVYLGQPENIQQQILFQAAYSRIFFDAKINAMGITWHGPVSSDQYRTVFLKCLEFVKVYSTPNYISDLSDQGYVSKEDQQWMFGKILPAAVQYGLKKVAVVKPLNSNENDNNYIKGIKENLAKLGLNQEYFLNIEEAIDWFQQDAIIH